MSRNLLPFQQDLSRRRFQDACYDLGQFLLAAVVNACDSKDFPFTDIQVNILQLFLLSILVRNASQFQDILPGHNLFLTAAQTDASAHHHFRDFFRGGLLCFHGANPFSLS